MVNNLKEWRFYDYMATGITMGVVIGFVVIAVLVAVYHFGFMAGIRNKNKDRSNK